MSVTIKDGKIEKYRVNMQMTFEVDAPASRKK
jgi:flavin-binding protein dodecin